MKNKYYVYMCYVDGVVKYIGKGSGSRYKHCNSGKSSCVELNKDFFDGKQLEVKFISTNLTEEDAFDIEADNIQKHKDTIYNKQTTRTKGKTDLVAYILKNITPFTEEAIKSTGIDRNSVLTQIDKYILVCLASMIDAQRNSTNEVHYNHVWVTYSKLVAISGVSKRSIHTSVAKLISLGYLIKEYKGKNGNQSEFIINV